MINKLLETVTAEQIIAWLIIAVLFIYFIYKEWPEFKRRVTKKPIEELTEKINDRTILERLDTIEANQKTMKTDIKEINTKLIRDYDRINNIEIKNKQFEFLIEESLEERGILMKATLGILGGLQELGANGETKIAIDEIQEYMNKKAHEL